MSQRKASMAPQPLAIRHRGPAAGCNNAGWKPGSVHRKASSHWAAAAAAVIACAWPATAGERILVLSPHVAEVLAAVGAADDVVGVGDHTDEPPAMRDLPRVGGAHGVAVEAALRLEPTLAFAYTAGLPGLSRLEGLGVRVVVSYPRSVSEAIDEIERIGSLAGRPERAREVAAGLRERLAALRRRRPDVPPRAYYEVAAEPLISVGPGNFVSDVLREVGALNVFEDVPTANPRVSVEAVLRARPDVLVLPGEREKAAARARDWAEHFGSAAPAWIPVPADLLHRPGPRLLEGMEILQARILNLSAPAPKEPPR